MCVARRGCATRPRPPPGPRRRSRHWRAGASPESGGPLVREASEAAPQQPDEGDHAVLGPDLLARLLAPRPVADGHLHDGLPHRLEQAGDLGAELEAVTAQWE